MKQEIHQLMNGKPAEFVRQIQQKLHEKKQIVLENTFYVFSKELNESFGGQLNEDELKDAYYEGKKAHADGKSLEDNPYEKDSEKGQQWGRGFSINDKQEDLADDGEIDDSNEVNESYKPINKDLILI